MPEGAVAALVGDFTPAGVALSLALLKRNCIWVPLATGNPQQREEFCEIAEVERVFEIDPADEISDGARAGAPSRLIRCCFP